MGCVRSSVFKLKIRLHLKIRSFPQTRYDSVYCFLIDQYESCTLAIFSWVLITSKKKISLLRSSGGCWAASEPPTVLEAVVALLGNAFSE